MSLIPRSFGGTASPKLRLPTADHLLEEEDAMELVDYLDTEPFPTHREKRHRLPRHYYVGMIRVSLTVCIKDDLPAFTEPVIVTAMLERLRTVLDVYTSAIFKAEERQ